jgi:hypothetical protein
MDSDSNPPPSQTGRGPGNEAGERDADPQDASSALMCDSCLEVRIRPEPGYFTILVGKAQTEVVKFSG